MEPKNAEEASGVRAGGLAETAWPEECKTMAYQAEAKAAIPEHPRKELLRLLDHEQRNTIKKLVDLEELRKLYESADRTTAQALLDSINIGKRLVGF